MLMALTEEDTSRRSERFPPVAALGYALVAVEQLDAAHSSHQEYEQARAQAIVRMAAEEF